MEEEKKLAEAQDREPNPEVWENATGCTFKVLNCRYFEDITYVSLDFQPVGDDLTRTRNLRNK